MEPSFVTVKAARFARQLTRILLASAILILGWSSAARAEFKVCNQSATLYNVAIGAQLNQKFVTKGWWTLPPNACVNVIEEDLEAKNIYVYATTVTGESAFDGDWDMCVDSRRFEIPLIDGEPWNCWIRGKQQVKFKEINTGEAKSWTIFIRNAAR
jgi:uncharacterized membrane protein